MTSCKLVSQCLCHRGKKVLLFEKNMWSNRLYDLKNECVVPRGSLYLN